MRLNGRSPFAIIMRNGLLSERVSSVNYKGGNISPSYTPIMGWSSAFMPARDINAQTVTDIADSLEQKGLTDAGYNYIYLSKRLDESDAKIADNIPILSSYIRSRGLRPGVSSRIFGDNYNVYNAEAKIQFYEGIIADGVELYGLQDADVGQIIRYAIVVGGMWLTGGGETREIPLSNGRCTGLAKVKRNSQGSRVTGLDGGHGQIDFEVDVDDGGEYRLRVKSLIAGKVDRLLIAETEGGSYSILFIPKDSDSEYAECDISLHAGKNRISMYNPIADRYDQVMMYADQAGKYLRSSVMKRAETDTETRSIVYYLDLEGRRGVNKWGYRVGNTWSPARHDRASWGRVKAMYNKCLRYYNCTGSGCWCNAGELYLGLGKLNQRQSIAQFSLWCMLNSPLMIAADVRHLSDTDCEILKNRELIELLRDGLCRPAKRIKGGVVDMIARPLSDGDVAVCIFNNLATKSFYNFSIDSLVRDDYIKLISSQSYTLRDLWQDKTETVSRSICGNIDGDSVKVYRLSKK